MSMEYEIGILLAYGFGIVLLYLAGYLFLAPLKVIFKLFLNSILGGICIFVINFLGDFITIHIPLNAITAIITGFLGIPGVILILLIDKIF